MLIALADRRALEIACVRVLLRCRCTVADHVSVSLINRDLPHTYADVHQELHVAFLMRASTRFECASVTDGGTVMIEHGGCDRPTCPGGWCVYRFSQLAAFMQAHMDNEVPSNGPYNEVVILKDDWERMLPGSIEAVACVNDRGEGDCDEARRIHGAFLSAYRLSAREVPLVRYRGVVGFELIA